jgi:hypothetical protein
LTSTVSPESGAKTSEAAFTDSTTATPFQSQRSGYSPLDIHEILIGIRRTMALARGSFLLLTDFGNASSSTQEPPCVARFRKGRETGLRMGLSRRAIRFAPEAPMVDSVVHRRLVGPGRRGDAMKLSPRRAGLAAASNPISWRLGPLDPGWSRDVARITDARA